MQRAQDVADQNTASNMVYIIVGSSFWLVLVGILTSNHQGYDQIAQLSQKQKDWPTQTKIPLTSMHLILGRKTYLQ